MSLCLPLSVVWVKHNVKYFWVLFKGFSAGLFAFYHDDDGNPLTARYANGLPLFNERYILTCNFYKTDFTEQYLWV